MSLSDAGEGKMWISQERIGLGLYDLIHDKVTFHNDFQALSLLSLEAIKHMSKSQREHNVWIVPEGKQIIYEFDRKGMQMKHVRTLKLPADRPKSHFTQTYEDRDGTLWAGTNHYVVFRSGLPTWAVSSDGSTMTT